jgi:2-(1,2-epoxy-1,2-dihydrophenyl)acetyl-CoA isomerase
LINEIVPAEELRNRAQAVARELANGPTGGFAHMRALLRDTWRNDLSTQLQAETEALRHTGDTADAARAINDFADKRRPEFTGE